MDTPEIVETTLDALYRVIEGMGEELKSLKTENKRLKEKIEVLELAQDLTQYTKEQLQENETLKAMLKEAYPLLRRHTDSECLGPKSLLTRIFDTVIKEK